MTIRKISAAARIIEVVIIAIGTPLLTGSAGGVMFLISVIYFIFKKISVRKNNNI